MCARSTETPPSLRALSSYPFHKMERVSTDNTRLHKVRTFCGRLDFFHAAVGIIISSYNRMHQTGHKACIVDAGTLHQSERAPDYE